jgi:cytochrome c-type biogenesis protein CcmH/NrfF
MPAATAPDQAHAGAPDPAQAEALMQQLAHDLMSPYCPGRTIASCPSPQARKLEEHILGQAREGKSRAEIEEALVARFPDIRGYVGRPEIIYGTALLALLAIVGIVMVARRWVGRAAVGAPAPVAAGAAPVPPPGAPSRREIGALDDALDRIDEF